MRIVILQRSHVYCKTAASVFGERLLYSQTLLITLQVHKQQGTMNQSRGRKAACDSVPDFLSKFYVEIVLRVTII